MNETREGRLREIFDKLIFEANQPPQGIAWHAEYNLMVPIDLGHEVVIGSLAGSQLNILQKMHLGRRLGMGTYRIALAIIPDAQSTVGRIIT